MDQGGELYNNPEVRKLFTWFRYDIRPTGADASNQNAPVERGHLSKPDARILFQFCSFGSFYRENVGAHGRTQFESQTYSGIAVRRDRNSNALIFWCPDTPRFVTSADYTLDENKDLKDAFPTIVYDGGLEIRPLHATSTVPIKFSVGNTVHFQVPGGSVDEIAWYCWSGDGPRILQ